MSNATAAFLALAALVPPATATPALATSLDHSAHGKLMARVATYRPAEGFSQVVGDKRFTGFFMAKAGVCRVSLIVSRADDEQLVTAPQRLEFDLGAAKVFQISADHRDALGVACTVDADTIKVSPLHRATPDVTALRD